MTEAETEESEIKAVLARSRKLIAESRALIDQVELRRAETDRFLASQGLTRDQVMEMRFTREQKLAVNEELRRRGLPPLEEDDGAYDFSVATEELRNDVTDASFDAQGDVLEERRRKFGAFMQEVRL